MISQEMIIISIAPDKRGIQTNNIFICPQKHMLWYTLEVPCQGYSNEYPQHMFSWTNKKNIIFSWKNKTKHKHLIWAMISCEELINNYAGELVFSPTWHNRNQHSHPNTTCCCNTTFHHASKQDNFSWLLKYWYFFTFLHVNICCGSSSKSFQCFIDALICSVLPLD